MHLTLCSFGSRGDVQPYLALGLGLQDAGHAVRIATSRFHESLVRRHGLDYFPLTAANPRDVLRSESGMRWLETGSNPIANLRAMRDLSRGLLDEQVRAVLQLCADTEAVIHAVTTMLVVAPIAEQLGVPAAGAWLQPLHPTREFPPFLLPALPPAMPLRGRYNRLAYDLQRRMSWHIIRHDYNAMRGRLLGLPPLRRPYGNQHLRPDPVVYGFSRQVIPKPRDWDAITEVSGYWFLRDEEWRPPASLTAFLRAGPPPVYVGFGSMPERDAGRSTQAILSALQQTGLRAVLLGGWAGLGGATLPDSVLQLEYAPHEWLFPRMAAVVHHGGMGTVGAGLRAGRPTLMIPRFADQPMWARRLQALGVSPPPIPHRRLTAARLARALQQLTGDAALRERAASLGEKIRTEDGVGEAVRFLTMALENSPRRRRLH